MQLIIFAAPSIPCCLVTNDTAARKLYVSRTHRGIKPTRKGHEEGRRHAGQMPDRAGNADRDVKLRRDDPAGRFGA